MRIGPACSLLVHNPRLFARKLRNRILSDVLYHTKFCRKKKINGVFFEFPFNYDPLIARMYLSDYEVDIVSVMKRYLKPGDTFIDVGANIGYLSAVALGLVGQTGEVHSFEPVPEHFRRLRMLKTLNPGYNFTPNNCGLADRKGTAQIDITNLPNIGWNTMVPGLMAKEVIKHSMEVPLIRLDAYIAENEIHNIALIKVDVEGFECPVLIGLSDYFQAGSTRSLSCPELVEGRRKQRPPIICEINPSSYPLVGYSLAEFSDYLKNLGYRAYSLADPVSEVDILTLDTITNVLLRPAAAGK